MADATSEVTSAEQFLSMVGWFDGLNDVATYDPIPNNTTWLAVPSPDDVAKCRCMICEQPLYRGPVRTVSLMYSEHPKRSYFFRIHRACQTTDNDGSSKCMKAIERFGMEEPVKA